MSQYPPDGDQRESLHYHRTQAEATRAQQVHPKAQPSMIGKPVTVYGMSAGMPSSQSGFNNMFVQCIQQGAPMAGQIIWHSMAEPAVVTVAGFDHVGQQFMVYRVKLTNLLDPNLCYASQFNLMAVLA